ncbi:TIGR04282 family arsenosugar biosynthesis glycosyltransferase [Hyphomonas sp.]|uniref:TIGR04282 family arsenosugar biosynthesis glycosyltransferase n=1 Tax=Hyphomonas sp. TaxID=87 RepID=UPI003002A0EC
MRRARLLIFAKPPRMGLAKTRLAAGMGRTEARRIAHFTLARTMRAVRACGLDAALYLAPDRALDETLGGIWPPFLPRFSQGPGTLTERLGKGLADSPNGPVLFIGTDAPDISAAHLHHAVRALQRHDAVFGPAEDGGFWLFGVNKRPDLPPLFDNVRWSGPHALADVRANLPSSARLALLQTLQDVDDRNDWKRWSRNKLR